MNKVLYDNTCSFCRKIKSILSDLDTFNSFIWISNHQIHEDSIQIDEQKIEKSIVLITSSGKVYLEFYACRYIAGYIPIFWPILPFLFIPFISPFLGNIIYRRISRKRYCKS